jgi:hypothetical protein
MSRISFQGRLFQTEHLEDVVDAWSAAVIGSVVLLQSRGYGGVPASHC